MALLPSSRGVSPQMMRSLSNSVCNPSHTQPNPEIYNGQVMPGIRSALSLE
jgi:hypothetical protein